MRCVPKEVQKIGRAVKEWDDSLLQHVNHSVLKNQQRLRKDWNSTTRAYHRQVRRELRRRGLL